MAGRDAPGRNDRDLRKLGRLELLDILAQATQENEDLRAENERLSHELADRRLAVKNAGSLAEAALAVNGYFSAAQAAADQYVENARLILEDAQKQAERIVAQAESEARAIRNTPRTGITEVAGQSAPPQISSVEGERNE